MLDIRKTKHNNQKDRTLRPVSSLSDPSCPAQPRPALPCPTLSRLGSCFTPQRLGSKSPTQNIGPVTENDDRGRATGKGRQSGGAESKHEHLAQFTFGRPFLVVVGLTFPKKYTGAHPIKTTVF